MKASAMRIALVFATASLVVIGAEAAPPPSAPTPGQVQSTLPTQPPQPNLSPAQSISQPAPTPSGVAAGGAQVTVVGFDISGNTVVPTGELQAQIAGYVGKRMTLAELYDVADVLTRYYRSKGYGLAYVSLPAQTLKGGRVRLEVLEGRIGKVGIQGNSHTRTAVLAKRASSLKSGDVYTTAAAERSVLLMNDLPGVTAHEVLSPGSDYGTSDVLFNVDETRSSGDVSIDDYGRSVIGRWRVNADFYIDSLSGSGDQLGAGITHSDGNRLNFGKLSYSLPMGEASTFAANYNRAEYHGTFFAPGGTSGLPFSGSTQNAGLSWQYAETRSNSRNLYWTLGPSWDNSRSLTTGTNSLTTNILLLQLGSLYSRVFADQSSLTLGWNLWTNGKHYDHAQSLNNVSAERARSEFDTTYQLPFANVWSFVGQASLTYSVNPLTDADKFNLGGPNSVLGYQSAEQRGDSGYFLSTELERAFAANRLLGGVFLDAGKVWDKAGTIGVTGDSSRGISSGGLDLQLLPAAIKGVNARLQWAYAIGRRPSDGDGGGHIWLTVGMTY